MEHGRYRYCFMRMRALVPAVAGLIWLAVPVSGRAQVAPAPPVEAPPESTPESPQDWAIHEQATLLEQYHPAFRSDYRGPQSLDPGSRGDETFDATLYGGVRLWHGAEAWVNAEIDQGFGISDTLGLAAYTSGEAYKVGAEVPYVRVPRLFLRQTVGLGDGSETLEADQNILRGQQDKSRLVFTVGKFGVADIFDQNKYAHDSRNDFFNWAIIDLGNFDYAADAWGYTYGAAGEWYQNWWTLRAGAFTLSRVPNSKQLDTSFGQVQYIAEAEERHTLWGQPGKLRLLGFLTRGNMGAFDAAIAYGLANGVPANIAAVRNYASRTGGGLNLEQAITDQLGLFARAGLSEGGREPYEFTDVDKSFSIGLALQGKAWGRDKDTVGLATVLDDISRQHKNFLAAGGLGILVGDGQLPNSGPEQAVETYYSYGVTSWMQITADYQFINNPAYNRDRGPVSVLGLRLHAQY